MSEAKNQTVDSAGPGTTSNGNLISLSHNSSVAANPFAALLAGAQQHQPNQQHGNHAVDSNAALMMTNAAATIAAVAAQAMQQMAGQHQQHPPKPPSSTSTTGFPPSLVAALQASQGNPLLPSATSSSAVPANPGSINPSQTALLAALAGNPQPQQLALSGLLPGNGNNNNDLTAALLRSSGAMLPQPSASVAAVSSLTSPSLLSNMQTWSAQQLEQHVALLQQANQPIPQSVALLLAEAQRKEKKKNAKRVANRKSASTSRARKKALVEEMTKTNARLKRQALILALLPDLVITTTPDGEITFCSAQVERILQYKAEDLVGAKLYELVVPSSREALKSLIEELVHPGKAKAARASAAAKARRASKRRLPDQRVSSDDTGTSKAIEGNAVANDNALARESAGSGGPSVEGTKRAAVVSEQSFPLSVVEVESNQRKPDPKPSATNENLDTSTNNSGGDDDSRDANSEPKKKDSKKRPRSDDSSSLSSDAKNMRANDNLDRNVRWHNQRMFQENKNALPDDGPKDDVTGASVTANNASARLSSLKHVPETAVEQKKDEKVARYENAGDQSSSDDSLLAGVEEKKKGENASDDSGYRESNDSREETSSSGSDTSQSNDRRKKYLAPAIRLCLVRDDLTTVWCEVTSSIRDQVPQEDDATDDNAGTKSNDGDDTTEIKPEQKELLLCLRPIREGDKKVDVSLRLCRPRTSETIEKHGDSQDVMISSGISEGNDKDCFSSDTNKPPSRPPKKRGLATSSLDSSSMLDVTPKKKRSKSGQLSNTSEDTEKSVVESLLKMNQSSQ